MDVYLLPRRSGEFFLTSPEIPEPPPDDVGDEDDSKAKKLFRLTKRGYDRLTRARRRREELLRSLGGEQPEPIRVLYPASLEPERAREIYDALIEAETQKHKKWMVANAAAMPLTIPLTLIPGPNVLLGFLAWRSFVHYKVKKAGERAGESALEVGFAPDPRLDELLDLIERWPFRARSKVRKLGLRLGFKRLDRAV